MRTYLYSCGKPVEQEHNHKECVKKHEQHIARLMKSYRTKRSLPGGNWASTLFYNLKKNLWQSVRQEQTGAKEQESTEK